MYINSINIDKVDIRLNEYRFYLLPFCHDAIKIYYFCVIGTHLNTAGGTLTIHFFGPPCYLRKSGST